MVSVRKGSVVGENSEGLSDGGQEETVAWGECGIPIGSLSVISFEENKIKG